MAGAATTNLLGGSLMSRTYMQSLQTALIQQRSKYEAEKRLAQALRSKELQASLAKFEPLEHQIHRWWINLPKSVQARKFQIADIAAHCHGRYRAKPALRQVAAALRVLGWTECRDWTSQGRNRRYWEPKRNQNHTTQPPLDVKDYA